MPNRRVILFVVGISLPLSGTSRAESKIVHPPFPVEVAASELIVYADMTNVPAAAEKDRANLVIAAVIKPHPALNADNKVISIPLYAFEAGPMKPGHYLLFAEVKHNRPDFYRAAPATEATVDYLKGLVSLDGKDPSKVLRYCAGYLEHKDRVVADDAIKQFMWSTDKQVCEAGKYMPARALRGRLLSANTPPELLRVYALLLANCGDNEDAKVLLGVLDRLKTQERPAGLDGILISYTLLARREGWGYVRRLMNDPKVSFCTRYHCVRAARFFHDEWPGFVPEREILALIGMGIDQPDMADIAIEDLRKWRCWKLTDRILSLYGQNSYNAPIVRRAILRYALQCPAAAAKELVSARRKLDRELVDEVEEFLQWTESIAPKK